jgi:phosphoribosylaminoimidazolecarboxamide formyltransferase/IMP cyclohydrolase
VSRLPIRRALVSVFDKQGLDRLAAALAAGGVEVVSTGSTAAALEGHGLRVTRVESLTGFPEMLDGRVKTLHPRVHAGLLADRGRPEHLAELRAAGIAPFELVVVNLYPFEETVASGDVDDALAVERIDVGGPAMVRAAAKNHASVAVVCDPGDYPLVGAAVAAGGTTLPERRALAAKAFARTAAYDAAVAAWAGGAAAGRFPAVLSLGGRLLQTLRYGENPHQAAACYAVDGPDGPWGLGAAVQLAGKELSYNNLLDADAALGLVAEHPRRPFAVVVKHTNPCGAAFGATLEEAYAGAVEGDPVSAYGGVVGLSRPLDAATAARLSRVFTEVVVAPGFDATALRALAGKPSLRLLQVDPARPSGRIGIRSVAGGLLVQEADGVDAGADDPAGWSLQAGDPPGPEVLADLVLAWSVVGHVKSNAVVLARGGRVVGVGAGQQSRVDAVRLAVAKAGERAVGAAAGSDAFFPFADGVEELAAAGVRAVAQPGGSVRDAEVTAAAGRAGVAMLHTGRRHFRH